MKVCWFGIYERDYSRNHVLISGLRKNGVEVVECNAYDSSKSGLAKYFNLIKKLRALRNEYDVLFCAFPINYNVIIAKIFQKKPICIDAFFPLYDAYVKDRKVVSKYSVRGLVYRWLDIWNLKLASVVITDTEQHRTYWKQLWEEVNVAVVPVGAHTEAFFPIKSESKSKTDNFLVTFHGSYIPLQGIEKIVDAAEILKEEKNITFRFIGRGKLFPVIQQRILDKQLGIELLPWLTTAELNVKLNEADVVLGVFGDTEKTDRVVPNKVFQGIAVKKPVITKDTVAIREIFTTEELLLCENNPASIASSVRYLYENESKRQVLADRGHERFRSSFTEKELGRLCKDILQAVF